MYPPSDCQLIMSSHHQLWGSIIEGLDFDQNVMIASIFDQLEHHKKMVSNLFALVLGSWMFPLNTGRLRHGCPFCGGDGGDGGGSG